MNKEMGQSDTPIIFLAMFWGGGGSLSTAVGVSADGSVAVGGGCPGFTGSRAFLRDAYHCVRNLKDVLIDHGLDAELTGWELRNANGISADGLTIVGSGTNPDGDTEAWAAVIPIPAGALVGLVMFGCMSGGAIRRKFRKA